MASALAADGQSLLVGENRQRQANDRTPPAYWLWPNGDPSRARKLIEAHPLIGCRAVPNSQFLITTDLVEPDVWIWNFETGKRLGNLGLKLPAISEPTRNGRWLVTKTGDEVTVWEVGTWRAISRWSSAGKGKEQSIVSLQTSWDSRLLSTATTTGAIKLWELPSGREVVTLTPPRPVHLADCQFSPDGSRVLVLTETGQMLAWDLAELHRELAKLGLDW
jgi:hypothetical protein